MRLLVGNDGSISLIVPTFFSMHAVTTLPLPGIVAYAIPPAVKDSTTPNIVSQRQRPPKGVSPRLPPLLLLVCLLRVHPPPPRGAGPRH